MLLELSFFIVINGVRGPEARRHVTMRRTEAGANVEDGSNNQKMVFQFDLYHSTPQTATCFPVILCIDLPPHRVPTASSVMQLVCYERQCPNIPCGALCTNNNNAPTAAWPAYAPVVLASLGSQTEIIETHVTRGIRTALSSLVKAWDVRTRTKTQE